MRRNQCYLCFGASDDPADPAIRSDVDAGTSRPYTMLLARPRTSDRAPLTHGLAAAEIIARVPLHTAYTAVEQCNVCNSHNIYILANCPHVPTGKKQ